MHGNEEDIYGNTGYQIIVKRHELAGHATTFQAAMRPGKSRALLDTAEGDWKFWPKLAKPTIRSKVEHPFRVIKQQFVFQKTKLKIMAKNRYKLNVLSALRELLPL